MQYGDNGPANGPDPEADLSLTSVTDTSARVTWNPDYNDDGSWDSGWQAFELDVDASGIRMVLPGQDTTVLSISNSAPDQVIAGVAVTLGTTINGSVQWSDLGMAFTDASNNQLTYEQGTNSLSVDTTTSDNPTAEEQLWVTASPIDQETSVVISGKFRFTTPAGTYPSPSDLFSSVTVYTGTASS